MGNADKRRLKKKRRMLNALPTQQWKDLIILTAQLLGAEFENKYHNYWRSTDGVTAGSKRWTCAQRWLWSVKGMSVRYDGSIYQSPASACAEEIRSSISDADYPTG